MTTGPREVVVVRTGVANTASVLAAWRRLGVDVRFADDGDDVRSATAVFLPGVGAFDAGLAALRAEGFDRALVDRVRAGRPTMAICLGMQLSCRSSEEARGDRTGLGLFDADVTRFPAGRRVPQMGWNYVRAARGCEVIASGFAYFANSYRVAQAPPGLEDHCAFAEHGGEFVAAIEQGAVVACQFHPELSGEYGRELLARWARRAFAGDGDRPEHAEATTC